MKKLGKKGKIIIAVILTVIVGMFSCGSLFKEVEENKSFAIYVEGDNGEYGKYNGYKFPGEGYVFNTQESTCTNGSNLEWDVFTRTLSITTGKEEHCKVYFDKVHTYDITFNANGGEVDPSTKSISNGSLYGILPVPTKRGYTFIGWYSDEELTEGVGPDTLVTKKEAHTLYAKYVEGTFSLSVVLNGGTWVNPSSETVTGDQTLNLQYTTTHTINNPTKDGYTFTGWTVSGEGTSISGTTLTMGLEASSITAGWSENDYTLTINPNGGSWNGSTQSQDFTIAYTHTKENITDPTREGYTFAGWTVSKGTLNGTTVKQVMQH